VPRYTVQARATNGEEFWEGKTSSFELEHAQLLAVGRPEAGFDIGVENNTTSDVTISVNGVMLGRMAAKAKKTFQVVPSSYRLKWVTANIAWEQYLLEAKDEAGNVVSSKDYLWPEISSSDFRIPIPYLGDIPLPP
jgi:hypothetical protein